MPRGRPKRIPINSPLQPPREKRTRYNLRSELAKLYVSDSDSSVIFIDTSYASSRTENLTKRNLRSKIRRVRRNNSTRSNNTNQNRQSRINRLTNASSQTDEILKCSICERCEYRNMNPLELLYENPDYIDQGQSSATIVERENSGSAKSRHLTQSERIVEPTNTNTNTENYNRGLSPRVENVPSNIAALSCNLLPLPEVDSSQSGNRVPQESSENEQESERHNRSNQAEDLNINENVSTTARVGSSSSYPFIFGAFNIQGQLFRPGSSEMELNSNWPVPVGPLQPDEMCLGDGSHNDNLQVHVIDLADIPIDETNPTASEED